MMETMETQPEMDKRFEPKTYEQVWQRRWAEKEYFRAEAPSAKPPFCIMIPPPNVTGKLHVGHALQSTLQDLLTRWRRMQGYNALWLPGTDHAGIATQLMVERQLGTEGTSRKELGRERFLERMWQWKEQYHGNIREQLDLLGASCDWTRERFTLDASLSRAVREAFVRLYREGLITRGEYMVNWSPALGTAVSDLEVEMKTVAGKLYHIAYPVEGSDERIVVATTRPETMLGDTAVALHPDDVRYTHLHGKAAILPLVGRRLPFIADLAVDREFGTGLVKITPFHDPSDFEMGRRHNLPGISVIGPDGRMTVDAGPDFAGLDRFEARAKVVARLRDEGWLLKIEEHTHNVGHSQRGSEPIEPLVSTQWFCDVTEMAAKALAANRDGRLALVPESWDKTWEHWLSNIKPWCISRQLWWGHQIPAWYTEDGRCFVALSVEEAAKEAGTDRLSQDPDVLDTWFSSALWPFSTLGWPDDTADYRTFYPTSVLVTGFDILFFWVARMAMAGLHFTGEVPFAAVHLTGLVRDAEGQKMSKTKGNVLDPSELIEEFGADAVRFTLASLDSPGRDIPLNKDQIAGYRAFGNKLWNATRFALSRVGDAKVQETIDPAGLAAPERWILSRLSRVAAEVEPRFAAFRFDEACNRLYHFFWGDFCDWYLELSKPALFGEAPRPRVGEVLLTVLDRALRLLHPVMPFLTEELWQRLPGHEVIHPETICLAPYPGREAAWESLEVEAGMDALIQVVSRVRALRAELGLAPKAKLDLFIGAGAAVSPLLAEQAPLLRFLGRVESVTMGAPPEGAVRDVVAGVEIGVKVERQELGEEERGRLAKELEKLTGDIARAEERLANPAFLAKAPAHVVEGGHANLAAMRERQAALRSGLGLS
ncbi:MAG TPA: valine--tRNA ligase [Thermoanaerobaculia bacterium]|jgi:valyl-tRNA synthetase|nr:valine--tRNA ligase [Thermoanaerobaculia bacterium]